MSYRQTFLASVAVCMTAALVACGGGSSNNNGGGTNPITVTLSGAPTTLVANTTAPITATVANDSASAGVSWSCAPSGSCGSFSVATTPSGTAVTYTAPSAAASVTITATSVTDGTKTATATVSITAPPSTLADGSYVFSLAGSDTSALNPGFPSPYFVGGVFTVSGGVITAGEQDFVDYGVVATDLIDPTASSFTSTADGNLQIILTTCTGITCPGPDPSVGVAGVETINASLVSATRARILEFDTFATSSGTLDLQDTTAITASPSGGYAFQVQGIDSGGNALAIGGVLSLDGTGLFTSASIFDQNRGGNLSTAETLDTTASSVTGPDASGRILVSLKPTDTTLPIVNFAGYIVDATHIRLAEVADPSGSTTGGIALGQNAANLAVDGNSYVVGMTGADINGLFHAAGSLSLASGNVTGSISYNDFTQQSTSAPITAGTYVADATGRVTLTGVTDGVLLAPLNVQLYVDGNGNALGITLDTTDALGGAGYLQTASATFSGSYVLDATGADGSGEFELDAVGPVASDGTSTLTGAVDLNWLSTATAAVPTADLTVSGTGVASGSGNTITGLDVLTPTGADAFDYYIVDSTKVIAIETDSNQLTLGTFELTQ